MDTQPLTKHMEQGPVRQEPPPQYHVQYPQYPQYPQPTAQNTVIVTQPATLVTMGNDGPPVSTTGAILFSCLVFWCCCWPLGLAAFIVAVSTPTSNTDARSKVRTANILSTIGLVIGVIIALIVIVFYVIAYIAVQQESDNFSSALNDLDEQLNNNYNNEDYSSYNGY